MLIQLNVTMRRAIFKAVAMSMTDVSLAVVMMMTEVFLVTLHSVGRGWGHT